MSDEVYRIRFEAEDQLTGAIQSIRSGLAATGTDANASKGPIAGWAKSAASLAGALPKLAAELNKLGQATGADVAAKKLDAIGQAADNARQQVIALAFDLNDLRSRNAAIAAVGNALTSLGRVAGDTRGQVLSLGTEVGQLRGQAGGVGALTGAVETLQRKTYGAKMNASELGDQLRALPAHISGVSTAAADMAGLDASLAPFRGEVRGVNTELGRSPGRVASFSNSIGGLAARVAVFYQLKEAIAGVGKAMGDARKKLDDQAEANLDVRDRYRELANLQGKAAPDNEVIGGAMRLRMATGLSDQEANEALRTFEGGIPFAKDAGNLTGSSTAGVAGDFFRESLRTALRVGLSGKTAADLAATLALQAKIPTADAGLNRFGTVIDSYNRGKGDLTPLITAGVRGSGGMVGKGNEFATFEDFVAAHTVASTAGSPQTSATRVRQAAAGLSVIRGNQGKFVGKGIPGLTDEWARGLSAEQQAAWVRENFGEKKLHSLQRSKSNDAIGLFIRDEVRKSNLQVQKVPQLGLSSGDFIGNLERLSPLLDGAENQDDALKRAGIENSAQRRAILDLYGKRDLIRKETDRNRAGSDVAEIKGQNAAFFASPTAQARIGQASQDASSFAATAQREALIVARRKAEARLRNRGDIDSEAAAHDEAMADMTIPRMMYGITSRVAGKTDPRALPLWMGGKSTRDLKVDAEAMAGLQAEAQRVKVDPQAFFDRNGLAGAGFEERFGALAKEVQSKGGNPYGSDRETNAVLNALLAESKRTNDLLQQQARGQQAMPFLPAPRPGGGR